MPLMKLTPLAACLALTLAPGLAQAAGLCDQLSQAVGLVKTGFDTVEGDPLAGSSSGEYRHSKIQLSAGDNCAVEAHKVLACSWEPSTTEDLTRMTASVAACFPAAQQVTAPAAANGDSETDFKLEQATIAIGLTADVLSLNVGP
jgi:hypothetical protein